MPAQITVGNSYVFNWSDWESNVQLRLHGKLVEVVEILDMGCAVVRGSCGTEAVVNLKELSEHPGVTYVEASPTVEQLRDTGHVVVIWAPEEIGDADASGLEDVMIERGAEYIAASHAN